MDEHLAGKIARQALHCPAKIALVTDHTAVSYGELEDRSNRLAHQLQSFRPGPSHIVMILDRSPHLVMLILAALKSGSIFVPIDPIQPAPRIGHMLEAIETPYIITSKAYEQKVLAAAANLTQAPAILFIEELEASLAISPTFQVIYYKYAYIFFTSGTTGKPKGILGRHRSLVHFIEWEIEAFAIDQSFSGSCLTSPSFDAILRDIFVPLTAGGSLCIPTAAIITEPAALVRWIDREKITFIHTVPSLFKVLLEAVETSAVFNCLRYIMLSGELLRGSDIRSFMKRFGERIPPIRLVNFYGPTETTMIKCFYMIEKEDVNRVTIPVGRPISHTQVMVLDSHMKKCLTGSTGEVYIRTPFITSGYIHDKEATRSVFLVNPFTANPQDIIYKTGDLGRMLPNGDLEVLGRIDRQVKIRGARVELAEIENTMLSHEAVKEAVVLDREYPSGEKYLCAYIVPSMRNRTAEGGANLEPVNDLLASIREYVSATLPVYMVPAQFVFLEKLPVTASGKIDRQALAKIQPTTAAPADDQSPVNETERKLAAIWAEVLAVQSGIINRSSGFFDIGGHSLKAAMAAAKIHQVFAVKVPLAVILGNTSLRDLARFIDEQARERYIDIPEVEKKEYYVLSPAQQRLYVLQQMNPDSTAYNLQETTIIQGLSGTRALEAATRGLISRHESLRTSFHQVNDLPVQRIHEPNDITFKIEDSDRTKRDCLDLEHAQSLSGSSFITESLPFDLSTAPLFRVRLGELEAGQYLFSLDMHHIISDAVSLVIMVEEFRALLARGENTLSPLRIQYKDYAQWLHSPEMMNNVKKQGEYWLEQFSGQLPVLELPANFSRPGHASSPADFYYFNIEPGQTHLLKTIAHREGVTLFMMLLALVNILLSKLSGMEDIIIGTPTAGRRHADVQNVIGMFVNTLVLRNYPQCDQTFTAFLDIVRQRTLEAFENQDYPFEELVRALQVKRRGGRNPLFDVMFAWQNALVQTGTGYEAVKMQQVDMMNRTGVNLKTAKFDITIDAAERVGEEDVFFRVEYNAHLYKKETIELFVEYFKAIVSAVIKNPQSRLGDIVIDHGFSDVAASLEKDNGSDFVY